MLRRELVSAVAIGSAGIAASTALASPAAPTGDAAKDRLAIRSAKSAKGDASTVVRAPSAVKPAPAFYG